MFYGKKSTIELQCLVIFISLDLLPGECAVVVDLPCDYDFLFFSADYSVVYSPKNINLNHVLKMFHAKQSTPSTVPRLAVSATQRTKT